MIKLLFIYFSTILIWAVILNQVMFTMMIGERKLPAYISAEVLVLSYFFAPFVLFVFIIMYIIGHVNELLAFIKRKTSKKKKEVVKWDLTKY